MIFLVLWITLCTALIIDVDFPDNNQWSYNVMNIENCTFRISSSKEKYIYVNVLLPQPSSDLLLVSQELTAVSNFSGPFSSTDLISILENRKTRFLKKTQSKFPLYISTFDSSSKLSYKIMIEASSAEKCDNDCSNNGICNEYGCECRDETVGNDCHIQATKISVSNGQQLILFDNPVYFYIRLDDYRDKSLSLHVSIESNSYNGAIFVYTQKSQAIYIPDSENYNQNLVSQKIIYDEDYISIDTPNDIEDDSRLVFAAIRIGEYTSTFGSALDISLKISDTNKSTTVSSLIVIIIVASIIFAIIIIIGLYYIFRDIRRKRLIELAARQRQEQNQNSKKQSTDHVDLNLIGLQPDQINPDETCSICLENLVNGKQLNETSCKHNFHHKCILAWGAKHQECPICRSNLVSKQA